MTPSLLEPLLASPRLPRYLDELQNTLVEEAERRERFFQDLLPHQKAEFINGEVIMHSPAKVRHTQVRKKLVCLIDSFVELHQLGWVGDEKVLVSLTRNDYEPDIGFWGKEKAARIEPDQLKLPAPDLVVEVLSHSTEKTDRTIKFDDYAAHGVDEYWIIDPVAETVEQYWLDGDEEVFHLHVKLEEGDLKSRIVAGLVIPVRAMFDSEENLKALRKILAG